MHEWAHRIRRSHPANSCLFCLCSHWGASIHALNGGSACADPNWGNFLYDEATGVLNLIDFGAARDYPVDFVRDYIRMVKGCAEKDREEVLLRSTRLGFLTGLPGIISWIVYKPG